MGLNLRQDVTKVGLDKILLPKGGNPNSNNGLEMSSLTRDISRLCPNDLTQNDYSKSTIFFLFVNSESTFNYKHPFLFLLVFVKAPD